MDSKRDRIISLLGQGYANATVASALGVTPSYVSQIADEDSAREEIIRLRVGKLQERVESDTKLESLEKRSLEILESKMAFVKSPVEAVKIFSTLNSAKRKTVAGLADQDAANVESVTITLPKTGSIQIKLNQNNQVVEVENRSMAPLPSRALHNLRPEVPIIEDMTVKAITPTLPAEKPQEVTRRLQQQDAEIASKRLQTLEVMIDGVPCVL